MYKYSRSYIVDSFNGLSSHFKVSHFSGVVRMSHFVPEQVQAVSVMDVGTIIAFMALVNSLRCFFLVVMLSSFPM